MSKFEKAKERILLIPKDYTYTEARYLLSKMGFVEKAGAVKDLVEYLMKLGEL